MIDKNEIFPLTMFHYFDSWWRSNGDSLDQISHRESKDTDDNVFFCPTKKKETVPSIELFHERTLFIALKSNLYYYWKHTYIQERILITRISINTSVIPASREKLNEFVKLNFENFKLLPIGHLNCKSVSRCRRWSHIRVNESHIYVHCPSKNLPFGIHIYLSIPCHDVPIYTL